MNEAPVDRYLDEVSRHAHVDQWVRWFALMGLINNRETSLSNGIDDDYSIYQGTVDPRIILLPHDLDTIFGLGDTPTSPDATIFQMTDQRFGTGAARMPQLEPFFSHPDIRPAYFQALHELMESVLEPAWFDPFVDSLLGHVPSRERDRIKEFNRLRREHVRAIIDAPITMAPADAVEEVDLYTTSAAEIAVEGSVSPRLTARILLNGEEVDYDRGTGTWRREAHALAPGINVLTARALDSAGERTEFGFHPRALAIEASPGDRRNVGRRRHPAPLRRPLSRPRCLDCAGRNNPDIGAGHGNDFRRQRRPHDPRPAPGRGQRGRSDLILGGERGRLDRRHVLKRFRQPPTPRHLGRRQPGETGSLPRGGSRDGQSAGLFRARRRLHFPAWSLHHVGRQCVSPRRGIDLSPKHGRPPLGFPSHTHPKSVRQRAPFRSTGRRHRGHSDARERVYENGARPSMWRAT